MLYKCLFAFLLFFSATDVYACLCGTDATVCVAYEKAKAVIVGEIVNVVDDVKNTSVTTSFKSGQVVKVKVHKSYKGNVGDYVDLWQPYTSCDVKFQNEEIGKSLLMYLDHESDPQAYSLRICSRHGSKEDISWLDSLPGSLKRPRIAGVITEYTEIGLDGKKLSWPERKGFLPDIAIELSNGRKTFRTKTNSYGVYELWDLPDGRYRFAAAVKQFRVHDESTNGFWDFEHPQRKGEIWFEVDGGGCAGVDYDLIKRN